MYSFVAMQLGKENAKLIYISTVRLYAYLHTCCGSHLVSYEVAVK